MCLVREIRDKDIVLSIFVDEDAEDPRDWDNLGTMVCFHRRYNLGDKHNYESYRYFLEALADEVRKQNEDAFLERVKEKIDITYEIEYDTEEKTWVILENDEAIEGYDDEEEAMKALQELKEENYDYYKGNFDLFDNEELMDIIEQNAVILPLYLYDHSGLSISTRRVYPYNDPWDAGQVGWIYVTHDKIKQRYGEVNDETLKEAEEVLINEVKIYDLYLRGEVYGYVLERETKCETCGSVVKETIDSCWGFYGYDIENMKYHMPEEYAYLLDGEYTYLLKNLLGESLNREGCE